MEWCRTDLGATAYNWERVVAEDMRFGPLTVYGESAVGPSVDLD